MTPIIAEVVFVEDRERVFLGIVGKLKADHPDLSRLEGAAVGQTVLIELRGSVDKAPNIELMQMAVGPAKGRLQHLVELGKVESDRQFDSAADLGLDAEDMDLGAHNEAVWIEWVKHAADHAAHEFRRQWMSDKYPLAGRHERTILDDVRFLASAGGAPASRLDHVRRSGGRYDASAAQPPFRLLDEMTRNLVSDYGIDLSRQKHANCHGGGIP